ncbi:MAG: DUF4105 domain-containing protein [Dokdonella sp.]
MTPHALRLGRISGSAFATTLIALTAAWGAFALWYQVPGSAVMKVATAGIWIVFSVAMIAATWRRRALIAMTLFVAAFAILLAWWHHLPASNDRLWADDVAQMTKGTIEGSQVTLRNVRNFDWRSDTDYTQRWETRHYDLDQLDSVDMILSYWSGPAIAHMLVSFGFSDGRHVAFSVEVRRERSEGFSEVGGFFKEFELSVIAADERDVIRVRTNVRGEDDYLYRVRMPLQAMRSLFVAYVDEANRLVTTPRFYNTVTANCTTLVYHMMTGIVGHLPLGYQLLLSGYLPEYVYARGALDQREPLDVLRALGRITERAKRADQSPTFSADIRVGIPALTSVR